MGLSLLDMLRHFAGGDAKEKPVFRTEREAYDFCRKAYKDTGGVTPELRRSFEFYQQSLSDDCAREFQPAGANDR